MLQLAYAKKIYNGFLTNAYPNVTHREYEKLLHMYLP